MLFFCSLGECCSHIAALLFKVEAAVRLGITNLACTDKPCEWNNFFSTKVEAMPIKDIKFYREEAAQKVYDNARDQRPTYDKTKPTDQEKLKLFDQLAALETKPVILSTIDSTCNSFVNKRPYHFQHQLPQPLRSLYQITNVSKPIEQLKVDVMAEISHRYSNEDIVFLEKSTMGQSKNMLWYEYRAGRVSSSFAHNILHTNQNSPAPYILKTVTQIDARPKMSEALRYGRDCEPEAFDEYSKNLHLFHDNAEIQKSGMRIHPQYPWLSSSADAVVKCSCHGAIVVEFKCPWTLREEMPSFFHGNNCPFMTNGKLKISHKYFTQVQLQMEVYGCSQCDFIIYTNKGIFRDAVMKDTSYLSDVVPRLGTFWEKFILPELLTRKLENQECQAQPSSSCATNTYCYCGLSDDSQVMVGCDGLNCPYNGWIHQDCIRPKRKTVPKGKWYCKECKKHKK